MKLNSLFSDKLIDNILISINLKNKPLEEILQEIQSKTKLIFQKVTKRYIIVFDKKRAFRKYTLWISF